MKFGDKLNKKLDMIKKPTEPEEPEFEEPEAEEPKPPIPKILKPKMEAIPTPDEIAGGVPEDPTAPVGDYGKKTMVGNLYLDLKDQDASADINFQVWDAVVDAAREKAAELGVDIVIDFERVHEDEPEEPEDYGPDDIGLTPPGTESLP